MKRHLLTGVACLAFWCTGCSASPRTGPFDVPVAVTVATAGDIATSPDERQAVQEIATSRLYFAFDKYDLKPESLRTLARVATLLKQYPAITLSIDGHCDKRGSAEYNYVLGEWRARAAYKVLVAEGVDPSRLRMVSYGKMDPAVPGNTEADMALNRRDNFVVLGTCR